MNKLIQVPINDCLDCYYCSYEYMVNKYFCDNKKEWIIEERQTKIDIPDWCPLDNEDDAEVEK